MWVKQDTHVKLKSSSHPHVKSSSLKKIVQKPFTPTVDPPPHPP